MVNLRDALTYISPELMEVLLPFVLIFTVIYAVSATIPHFNDQGKTAKKMRIVISLVIALLVIIPHVTGQYYYGEIDVVDVINQSIPQVAMIMIAVIMVMLLIASTNTSVDLTCSTKWLSVRWIALVIVILIFLDNMNYSFFSGIPFLNWFSDPEFQALLLIILVFGLIVWFITSGTGGNQQTNTTTQPTTQTTTPPR
jgi:hypothetical protein